MGRRKSGMKKPGTGGEPAPPAVGPARAHFSCDRTGGSPPKGPALAGGGRLTA